MVRSRPGRFALVTVGCWGVFLATCVGRAAALDPGCSQSGTTVTCTYSSGDNAFTVPSGVSTVHVVAVGGQGGSVFEGGPGGFGAQVTGDLAVTPGSTLYAVVGGNATYDSRGAVTGANGGGRGGAPCQFMIYSAGGGGESDVRAVDGDLTTRLLVAAGGGGAGCGSGTAGEDFGGSAGLPGGPGAPYGELGLVPTGATGGGSGLPGTGTAGGAGGAGGLGGPACSAPSCPGQPGASGAPGAGGQGGDGGFPPVCEPSDVCGDGIGGGGGGGGGLFGGGGGGGGGNGDGGNVYSDADGGGGGGGSSLVPPGGSMSLDTTGQPEVVISYTAS
jgi:hypothetical protein